MILMFLVKLVLKIGSVFKKIGNNERTDTLDLKIPGGKVFKENFGN